jgi:hypothetical protein
MSLLGKQVYANPTTPLWSGGGGSNLPTDPTFNTVTFLPSGDPPYNSTSIGTFSTEGVMNSTISILNGSNQLGSLQGTAFYAGVEANYPRVIYQSDGIDFQDPDGTSHFLATVDLSANRWDLSNISTINGAAYPPAVADVPVIRTGVLNFNAPAGRVNFSTPFSARPTITLQPTTLPPWSGGVEGSGLFYISSADSNGFEVGFSGNIAFFDPMPLMWMAVGS